MPGTIRSERSGSVLAHLAGLVVLGAVVAADPRGWYPFGPAKWLVVSTAIASGAAYAAWNAARHGWPALPRRTVAAAALLFATLAAAAAVGRDPLYAWIGTPERRLGVMTWVLLAACALIGAALGATGRAVWRRWVVVAAAWCGGYAAVEALAGAPIEVAGEGARLGGPFGSAAYLGAALCLLVPISAAVAGDARELRWWRIAAAIASVLGLIALVGSGSRAAWVGLSVAAVVAILVRRPSRRPLAGAAAVVIVATVVWAPRLGDLADHGVSADSRLDEWAMGARVFAEHPWLGVGPEGYRTALADGVTAAYERSYGRDVLPDRAHLGVLDVALAGGGLAGVAYLVLVAAVAWAAIGALRGPNAGLGVAALAYLVQQQFLFPLAELDPTLWMVAGMLLVGHRRGSATARASRPVAVLAGVVAALLFLSGVVGVAADRAARRSLDEQGGAALASAERAAELRPDVIRYHLLVAQRSAALGTLGGAEAAVRAADRAVDVSPSDPVAVRAAAQARLDVARITGRAGDLTAAVAAWQAIVADDPLCRACQYGLGIAAALAGQTEQAIAAWTEAAALSRNGDTRAADALAALQAVAGTGP